MFDAYSDLFTALSDPTRREILELLSQSAPLPASTIYKKFDVSSPAISQHLKVLRTSHLVMVEKKAQQRLYRLNTKRVDELETWIRMLRNHWNARFDRLEKVLQKGMKKGGGKIMEDIKRELTMVRTFDAPREKVFKAWLDPEIVKQWWGPKGVFNPVCEVDGRVGGKMHIVMEAGPELGPAKGMQWPMTGEFKEIEEPSKIVFEANAINNDKPFMEHLTTVTFDEVDGKTKMTVHVMVQKIIDKKAAEPALKGMEQGWGQQLDKLVEFIQK